MVRQSPTKERLFKVLDLDGSAFHGGCGKWSLPQNGQPGDWMPPIEGELVPCKNGYHLCRTIDLVRWLGPSIWSADCRGERLDDDNKIVVREARLITRYETWNERTARLFACDCAERVVYLCGDDERPRRAIDVARRYATGEVSTDELTAAWEAAKEAAKEASLTAAWTDDRDAAWAAAWAAAWDAARAAARADAWYAARGTEREWQTRRLMEYLDGAV